LNNFGSRDSSWRVGTRGRSRDTRPTCRLSSDVRKDAVRPLDADPPDNRLTTNPGAVVTPRIIDAICGATGSRPRPRDILARAWTTPAPPMLPPSLP
jgi:hypothetical protein